MSVLWLEIEPASGSIDDNSSDKGRKDQDDLDDQEQEEVVLVPRRNPIRLRWGDQIASRQLKIDIEISKDKLFVIKHMSAGSNQTKQYLVQVDMDQSDPVDMGNYGVYRCQ